MHSCHWFSAGSKLFALIKMVKTGAVLVTREISTFLFAAGLGSGLASGIEPLNFIVTSLVKHILDAEDWQLCHARKEELIR